VTIGLRRLLGSEAIEAREPPHCIEHLQWPGGAPSSDDLVVLGICADSVPTWLVLDGDVIVGMCGLHAPLEPAVPVEIGYHVGVAERGRGVGTTAVALLLAELDRHGVRLVVAEVLEQAPLALASRGVLVANGFEVDSMPAETPGAVRFVRALGRDESR